MQTYTYQLDNLESFIRLHVMSLIKPDTVFTFSGPLGAGKTTFIKELLRQCQVHDVITSPTFTYVQTYHGMDNLVFHHFDAYRIPSVSYFLQYGLDEYLMQPESICLIEWPEKINELLENLVKHKTVWSVQLAYLPSDANTRQITLALI